VLPSYGVLLTTGASYDADTWSGLRNAEAAAQLSNGAYLLSLTGGLHNWTISANKPSPDKNAYMPFSARIQANMTFARASFSWRLKRHIEENWDVKKNEQSVVLQIKPRFKERPWIYVAPSLKMSYDWSIKKDNSHTSKACVALSWSGLYKYIRWSARLEGIFPVKK
jgi:hypothetical protein